jgi:hypothetical protein
MALHFLVDEPSADGPPSPTPLRATRSSSPVPRLIMRRSCVASASAKR